MSVTLEQEVMELRRENERLKTKLGVKRMRDRLTEQYGRLPDDPSKINWNVGSFQKVIGALEAVGCSVKWFPHSNAGHCRCPAHDDNGPSLSLREKPDGKMLLHCFAGCQTEDVLRAAGLTWADLSGGA